MRDSLIFYRSFYEAIKELPKEIQAEVYTAIFEYSLNFNEVELSGLSKTIFILIKPQLEANNKKFINGKQPKGKQKGSKKEAKTEQTESKQEGNVNDNVNNNNNFNENSNDNEKKIPPFSFRKYLIELVEDEKLVDEFMLIRKKKKAVDTETAFNGLVNEINKSKRGARAIILKCVEKSWSGFESKWLENESFGNKAHESFPNHKNLQNIKYD